MSYVVCKQNLYVPIQLLCVCVLFVIKRRVLKFLVASPGSFFYQNRSGENVSKHISRSKNKENTELSLQTVALKFNVIQLLMAIFMWTLVLTHH